MLPDERDSTSAAEVAVVVLHREPAVQQSLREDDLAVLHRGAAKASKELHGILVDTSSLQRLADVITDAVAHVRVPLLR